MCFCVVVLIAWLEQTDSAAPRSRDKVEVWLWHQQQASVPHLASIHQHSAQRFAMQI